MLELEAWPNDRALERLLTGMEGVKRITRENGMLLVHSDRDCHTAVITALLTNGYDMRRLRQRGGDLDEIYSKYFEMAGEQYEGCLLYTSEAADELPCGELGGRRILKKKTQRRTGNIRQA